MPTNPLTGEEIRDEDLRGISKLAQDLKDLQARIAKGESLMAALKEQERRLIEEKIPERMLSIGLSEFKLATGEKVTVQKFYSAKIPDEKKDAAHHWLVVHGHADLIKTEFTISFGKGSADEAEKARKKLDKTKLPYEVSQGVHAQTLKSFIREQYESPTEGEEQPPKDLFGIYIGNRAKLKE